MEYFRRLKNFWFPGWIALVWLLFSLPALYFYQTFIHEGTHAVSALMVKGYFPKFAPFPHKNEDGNFLNGVTLGKSNKSVTVSRRADCTKNAPQESHVRMAGHPASPQFVALSIIVILSLILFFVPTSNPYVRLGLRAWFLGANIDFMVNTASIFVKAKECNMGNDWIKFMLETDVSIGWFRFLTIALWIVILLHFLWVYWSRWGKEAPTKTSFWDYRWYAVFIGCLSLIAFVFSVSVSDAAIIKKSSAYGIPFGIQCVALVWCIVYPLLTLKYKKKK